MSERGKVLLSGFWSWGYHWWTRKGNKSNLRFCATNIPFWHFYFWISVQVRPFTGRMSANSVYAEMTQVCWVGRLILKLKWRQTKYFFCKGWRREKSGGRERFLRKCRRERESCWKTAVHKYTRLSLPNSVFENYQQENSNWICRRIHIFEISTFKHFCLSARVGVPATILAFSALYWGYGLSKYQEWSTTI